MVATDVASRGIGMVVCDPALPFPSPSPLQLTSCDLDVVLRSLLQCAPMTFQPGPGSSCLLLAFLARITLELWCSVACYAFSFRLVTYLWGTEEAEWALLELVQAAFSIASSGPLFAVSGTRSHKD